MEQKDTTNYYSTPIKDVIINQGSIIITTEDNNIVKLQQTDERICCEDWGSCIISPDGSYFDIYTDENDLNFKKLFNQYIREVHWHRGKETHDFSNRDNATLDIKTDNGVYQLVMWTEHNGYYPHNYYGEWYGKSHEDY